MNTNVKGSIGLMKVMTDLVESGHEVFTPISEHSTVDLIAYKDYQCKRIQVKYREPYRNKVEVPMHTVVNGKRVPYDLKEIDLFAIYCPQWGITHLEPRDQGYYLSEAQFKN